MTITCHGGDISSSLCNRVECSRVAGIRQQNNKKYCRSTGNEKEIDGSKNNNTKTSLLSILCVLYTCTMGGCKWLSFAQYYVMVKNGTAKRKIEKEKEKIMHNNQAHINIIWELSRERKRETEKKINGDFEEIAKQVTFQAPLQHIAFLFLSN